MIVLGIETSCDETGIALYDSKLGLLAHQLYSQVALHQQYGGVVPELASRDHIRLILPLIQEAFAQAKLKSEQIDAIAYTAGPGLAGALMVGAGIAHSLALAWNKKIIPVHHMEGHLLAPLLENKKPSFPFVALLVSGGHTQLIEVTQLGHYKLLGESLDDAAGEAFDKTAKLLGLAYPGGAALSQLAQQGNPNRLHFPRPLLDRNDLNFSFSGLKTAVVHCIEKNPLTEQTKADIAQAFEAAVIEVLIAKSLRALKQTGHTQLVVAGGVSANRLLRSEINMLAQTQGFEVFFPRLEFCTDNGAMIALAGALHPELAMQPGEIVVKPRWPLNAL